MRMTEEEKVRILNEAVETIVQLRKERDNLYVDRAALKKKLLELEEEVLVLKMKLAESNARKDT